MLLRNSTGRTMMEFPPANGDTVTEHGRELHPEELSHSQSQHKYSIDILYSCFVILYIFVIELCLLAYPCLKVTKGNIVNVSSAGAVRAFPAAAFYCSLKAALDHFTRNYAQIWGPDGIRINCLNPGPIETMLLERHGVDNEGLQKHDKWVEETTPLMRSGSPAEMSTILKFLASDEASYVTGASWLADGGHSVSTQKTNFV
ncbi:enoyl-(Acyl carrier protein) reductase domain-containing protein [Ditylenchus destructor]|nr:enoyl-(Acyl carrier protein) reductase domain-containing protein [Ditylenchus destructor]